MKSDGKRSALMRIPDCGNRKDKERETPTNKSIRRITPPSPFRGTKLAAFGAVHSEQLAPFLPVLVSLIIVVGALVLKGVRRERGVGKPPDERNDPLFRPAEHSLIGVLK